MFSYFEGFFYDVQKVNSIMYEEKLSKIEHRFSQVFRVLFEIICKRTRPLAPRNLPPRKYLRFVDSVRLLVGTPLRGPVLLGFISINQVTRVCDQWPVFPLDKQLFADWPESLRYLLCGAYLLAPAGGGSLLAPARVERTIKYFPLFVPRRLTACRPWFL